MQDANLPWGGDLSLGPTGDLSLVNGQILGQQRVLRRLLTNLSDYSWNPAYGGGLGQFVGGVGNARAIEGAIRGQLYAEAAVAHQPEPTVSTDDLSNATIFVSIVYADAASGSAQTLTFSLGA
jgi:hypothetical protein